MDLTSCTRCGIVLDKDNIFFPDTHDNDSNVEWDGWEYVAVAPCPVCGNNIRK